LSQNEMQRIQKLEAKVESTRAQLEKAQEKLPTQRKLKLEHTTDESTGTTRSRLRFEEDVRSERGSKLKFTAKRAAQMAGNEVSFRVHQKISENEQDNVGVEAAHKTEMAAESAVRMRSYVNSNRYVRPYKKVSKLQHKLSSAEAKLNYEKNRLEHPEATVNRNKYYQKQAIKKEYAAARRNTSVSSSTGNTVSIGKTIRERVLEKAQIMMPRKTGAWIWLLACLAFVLLFVTGLSSCGAFLLQSSQDILATSYLSEDDAIIAAENQYCIMEDNLRWHLQDYETLHPEYDEYFYELDDIEHDPYVLISMLSALHNGSFTLADVQSTLFYLFDKQYIITEEVITQTRYVDGEETNYYVCTVKLENFNLSHVPVYIMNTEQLAMYAAYMSHLGNREDLFPASEYVDKYIENPPAEYNVRESYLEDPTFATLITEAEKYLGYPYVWGGGTPETSFDCSGFVSYVLTNSGLVHTGRLGTQQLYNICTPISKTHAKPGDLVFFTGTYDTPGISHVGIYVGDGMMLHCGDPIHYTSIETYYWTSHLYAFGRPHY